MIDLSNISTKPPKGWSKENAIVNIQKNLENIGQLQDVFHAAAKKSMLIIVQGMDASGKDGVIKNVMTSINPMGVNVFSFKKPTELEMSHDFLWRIHQVTPPKGMIHVFNRSHYEDILIQRVHQWIDEATVERRIRQINDFEKMLVENDTVLIKFYLHVSFEEQLERLQERLTDPKKKWKHNENDMKEREFWPEYMEAYNDVLNRCNEASPWHIIPTDSNRYKEELISGVVRSHLEGLKLEYPQ